MVDTGSNLGDQIKHRVLQKLGRPQHSSRRWRPDCNRRVTTFHMNWRPLEVFQTQECEANPEDVLPTVITITGDLCNALATGCLEYGADVATVRVSCSPIHQATP